MSTVTVGTYSTMLKALKRQATGRETAAEWAAACKEYDVYGSGTLTADGLLLACAQVGFPLDESAAMDIVDGAGRGGTVVWRDLSAPTQSTTSSPARAMAYGRALVTHVAAGTNTSSASEDEEARAHTNAIATLSAFLASESAKELQLLRTANARELEEASAFASGDNASHADTLADAADADAIRAMELRVLAEHRTAVAQMERRFEREIPRAEERLQERERYWVAELALAKRRIEALATQRRNEANTARCGAESRHPEGRSSATHGRAAALGGALAPVAHPPPAHAAQRRTPSPLRSSASTPSPRRVVRIGAPARIVRVVLAAGAVVRAGSALTTTLVCVFPRGTLLEVKAVETHYGDVTRLRVDALTTAMGGEVSGPRSGWISERLRRPRSGSSDLDRGWIVEPA